MGRLEAGRAVLHGMLAFAVSYLVARVVSPGLGPPAALLLAFVAAWRSARSLDGPRAVHGLVVGATAAAGLLVLTLGTTHPRHVLSAVAIVAAGWFGGRLAERGGGA